jgi:hypothetical protein
MPTWLTTIRKYTKWLIFLAIINLLIADSIAESNFPREITYAGGGPKPPAWLANWGIISIWLVLLLSLISLPKWQSFLGIAFLFVYLAFILGPI